MGNQNKKNKRLFLAILLIFFVHIVLFFLLRNKIIITPDFVGSDAFHVNYSLKQYLSSSFRQGRFPFWTDLIQGGFPIFAEGQMGALFIPNSIAVLVCGTSGIYPFLLTTSIFFLTLGMFILLKNEEVPIIASLLLSLNFAWVGSVIFGWVHLTILQSFSLVPFLYIFYCQWIKTQNNKYGFMLSLLLSQMFFAGNVQIVFISALSLILCSLFHKEERKKFPMLLLWLGLGTIFALPQLLPSYQLHNLSSRSELSGYSFAVSVPFKIKSLLGFILYGFMGNPKYGTYPLNWREQGIFWENTPYVGMLFFIPFIFLLIYNIWTKTKEKRHITYLFISLLFICLALGDSSPFYFIFDLFPFTLFRATGRFLLITIFFMFFSMGFLMKVVRKLRPIFFVICALLFLNFIHLTYVAFDYNLLLDEHSFLNLVTHTPNKLKSDSSIYILGFNDIWTSQLKKSGWATKKEAQIFAHLSQLPYPNSNLISSIPSWNQGNVGLTLRRSDAVSGYLDSILKDKEVDSEKRKNALSLYGVGTIITLSPTKTNDFDVTYSIVNGVSNHIYVPERLKKVEYVSEINSFLNENGISEQKGIVENHVSIEQNKKNVTISSLKYSEQSISARYQAKKDGFLVFKKNWYPEWKVFIDNKEVATYRTNISYIGVEVPSGYHTIELIYVPKTFYMGVVLGVGSFLCCVGFFLIKKFKKNED